MRLIPPMVLALAALPSSAHDFWIRPSRHRAAPGEVVKVHLKVGEHMKGEAVRRNPARMESLTAVGPSGELPLPGLDGGDPAGLLKTAQPGLYVVAYRGRPAVLELPAAKFEAYLREEGLEAVIAKRRADGATDRPGRERFIRCAKAFVQVGEGAAAGFDRPLGLRLELVPESDPQAPGAPDLPLRVVFEGSPLAGVKLVAQREGDPGREVSSRTDAEGRARLPLGAPGRWMVKAVHMVPARSAADADWESLWASLSFEVAPPTP
ncbi:MAG: DUF4198 domain-containing protein [Holophagaceae bacterium]